MTSLSPCSHWLNSPCPCGHTINFKISEVFEPKSADVRIWRTPLVRKIPPWTNPLSPDCGVFYGRPLKSSPEQLPFTVYIIVLPNPIVNPSLLLAVSPCMINEFAYLQDYREILRRHCKLDYTVRKTEKVHHSN